MEAKLLQILNCSIRFYFPFLWAFFLTNVLEIKCVRALSLRRLTWLWPRWPSLQPGSSLWTWPPPSCKQDLASSSTKTWHQKQTPSVCCRPSPLTCGLVSSLHSCWQVSAYSWSAGKSGLQSFHKEIHSMDSYYRASDWCKLTVNQGPD